MAKIKASAAMRWGRSGWVRRNFYWAVPLIVAILCWSRAAFAANDIVLQLHGAPQFAFAGYYAALWKNFYSEAGLSVDIRPGAARGRPAIDAIREVTDGRAQFGTGSAIQ